MTFLIAIIGAVFMAWWLSNALWWRIAKRIRQEHLAGGSSLRQSLRWFVWTTYIPFAAACFFVMILLIWTLPEKLFGSVIPVVISWMLGSALLLRFGEALPVVGSKSRLALRAFRKQSIPFVNA